MSVIAVDILLKSAIEAGIADLRSKPYLLHDVFSGLSHDAISQADYGDRETARAIDWFQSNNIPVYLQHRTDQPTFPSIIIVDMGSAEMEGTRTSLADDLGAPELFNPSQVEQTPYYVVPPFTPQNYDAATGTVTLPSNITAEVLVPGYFLVSQRTGHAYVIRQVTGGSTFTIAEGTIDDFTSCSILPQTALWNMQKEQTFFRHSFVLFAAAESESVQANWLWQVLVYCLLRYKEAFLEGRGFDLSTFQSGPLTKDATFDPQVVFYRHVTLIGQVQCKWIKYIAPQFAAVSARLQVLDGPATPPAFVEQVEGQAWSMEDDNFPLPGEPIPLGTEDIDIPIDGADGVLPDDGGEEQND